MTKKNIITVKDANIRTMDVNGVDYICITDIARQKNDIDPNGVIGNWMRNRNTIEFLGLWETLYNPNFNPLEFEGVRNKAGLKPSPFLQLNQIAIQQMQVLEGNSNRNLLK